MSINDSPSLHPAHSANHESSPARRTLLKSLVAGGASIAFGAPAHAAAASHIARIPGIVNREGRVSPFQVGDHVRVSVRYPIGHYRTPFYLRGKPGQVVRVVEQYINPEQEAFGHNAGSQLWLYQVRFSQKDLWPENEGAPSDTLQLEIFENWLEKA
ncbi:SH3-like domain-containing protein [Burkholderia gladioli]|uniref:SH3-like domain-containing protein n=1 Tax=Burkholderia gladioli TaxID=28095 RepID=UPI000CFF12A2|nr:SH3-like domain-containing protein [Burkholderia gladioli]PRH07317.1 nitrile hydratase [Burkholderia gladioli]